MILVSGAAGKTGLAVTRALSTRGKRVRAWVRCEAYRQRALGQGAAEVVVGDLRNPQDWQNALHGVEAVYHICPNMSPDEESIAAAMLEELCRLEGVQLVYHSVLHPQVEAMPHHWAKMRVEERIFASGVPFTILQPSAYFQNLLAFRQSILEQGCLSIPYSVQARLSMVDLQDVAEAAAQVLCEDGHAGAIYELAGPQPVSHEQVAQSLSRLLRRPIQAQTIPLEDWVKQAQRAGMSAYAVETLAKMFAYYDAHGLIGNARVLTCLLGRAPVSLEEFLSREFSSQGE
ncbi:SDR family oxidoreductase [Anaerolinea thermophila]|uniref:NmrA-like family protein n=1 Tax=Anaerolinea thermophila (strain DSM 14523 / JCM 11388 / NBRC 100420 / UNI-1) TaxID=926569 RepID=E8N1K3_ANATU|nr:NmrA family NAD(P)-binding protein [Anaerolinea thermophila]BAJ62608.1 NmrA-like family protein [Anaerolinea thermophila UNI-1]